MRLSWPNALWSRTSCRQFSGTTLRSTSVKRPAIGIFGVRDMPWRARSSLLSTSSTGNSGPRTERHECRDGFGYSLALDQSGIFDVVVTT
jgi:hypothetical protein